MDKTEIYVPKAGANEEPCLFISVNGKNYLIPRGRKSLVPAAVAAEYERALRAEERYEETVRKLMER